MMKPKQVAANTVSVKAAPDLEEAVRAHDADGKFTADDPKTPDVNEAFVEPKANKKKKNVEKATTVLIAKFDQSKSVYVSVNGRRRTIPVGVPTEIPAILIASLDDSNVEYEVVK